MDSKGLAVVWLTIIACSVSACGRQANHVTTTQQQMLSATAELVRPTEIASPVVQSPTPVSTAVPDSAALSGRIAYIGTDGNVWTIDPDGSDSQRLTSAGDNSSPAWSPDGSKLAYVHAGKEIRIITAEGSLITRLRYEDASCTDAPDYGGFGQVGWTPEGEGLIYHDSGMAMTGVICSVGLAEPLTPQGVARGTSFDVNSAGMLIYSEHGQGCYWLRVKALDGNGTRNIGPTMGLGCYEPAELPLDAYAPPWAPDSKHVAFLGITLVRQRIGQIRLMTADGSATWPLALVQDPQGGRLGRRMGILSRMRMKEASESSTRGAQARAGS